MRTCRCRRGEPVPNGQVLAEMIPGNAGAEEPAERIRFVGRSNGGGARGDWPCGLQRGEPRKFIGSRSHLGTQPVEDGEGGFFRARRAITGGAYAGRAALFALTGGDEFAGFLHEESVRSKEGFGKAYAAWVGVEEVQVWFEEFFGAGGDNVFHAGRSESFNRARKGRSMLRPYNGGSGFGIGSGWSLADGGAEVAAIAHEEQGGDGFEGVEKAEHAALALAHGEGERFKQRAFEGDPVRGRVHFVFGEFEFAVADILVGEEFDFLEADDLGADEDIAVGERRGKGGRGG